MPDTIFLKFQQFCRSEKLIDPYDKVIVALSGGIDSVFLLNLIKKLQPILSLDLVALHINHKLRDEESDNDELFCRDLCLTKGIPFFSESVNVNQLASEKKISIEMAARESRYTIFEKIRIQTGFTKIATAHNMDDNAETVLLNLIKGKGLEAVAGIPVKRGAIIRPVIVFSKDEILKWLVKRGHQFRIDSSNLDEKFQRNLIRNKVSPLLREINPEFSRSIQRFSVMLRDLIFSIAEPEENPVAIRGETIEVNIDLAKKLNDFQLFREISIRIIELFSLNLKFEIFYNLKELLINQTGRKIDIGEGVTCFRSRDRLIISRAEQINLADQILSINSKLRFGKYEISCEKVNEVISLVHDNRMIEYIDAEKITSGLTVRKATKGDWFFPVNGKGKRKLSNFFNDLKLEPSHKWEIPVLYSGETIVWVCGYRLDDRFKITNKTKTIFKLEIKNNEQDHG